MNKIYKVIWSKARNCYVVVSELAKRNGKNTTSTDKRRKLTAGLAMATLAVVLNMGIAGLAEAGATMNGVTGQVAPGNNSVAGGQNATAAINAVAVGGGGASASDIFAVAVGFSTTASGRSSVSVGSYSEATEEGASAFGRYAKAQATSATAIGQGSQATADYSTALGTSSQATGASSTALGTSSQATGASSTALGDSARATADNAIALGSGARALTVDSVAIGIEAGITRAPGTPEGSNPVGDAGGNAIAIGAGARNYTYGESMGMGAASYANVQNAIAIGHDAHTHAANTVAIGFSTDATGTRGIAIGTGTTNADTDGQGHVQHQGARAAGQGSIALGDHAIVVTSGKINESDHAAAENRAEDLAVNDAIAVGTKARTQAANGIAIGGGVSLTANGNTTYSKLGATIGEGADAAVAIGGASSSTEAAKVETGAIGAVSIGTGSIIGDSATNAIAIGGSVSASAVSAIAIGQGSSAAQSKATALGQGATASLENATALGTGATASLKDSVALGSSTTTQAGVVATTGTVGGITYGGWANTLSDTNKVVSVGNRQINQVAAGQVSSTSTDVVNGSQLYAVADQLQWKIGVTSDGGTNGAKNVNALAQSTVGKLSSDNNKSNVQFIAGKGIDISATPLKNGDKNGYGIQISSHFKSANIIGNYIDSIEYEDENHKGTYYFNGGAGSTNISVDSDKRAVVAEPEPPETVTHDDGSKVTYHTIKIHSPYMHIAGTNSLNIPDDTKANAEGVAAIAIGQRAEAKAENSLAVGHNADAKAEASTAIGYNSHAHGPGSVSIGTAATTSGNRAIAIGTTARNIEDSDYQTSNPHQGARAAGQGSIVLGDQAKVYSLEYQVADEQIGQPDTEVNDAIAIGTRTQARARNAIALGGDTSYSYTDKVTKKLITVYGSDDNVSSGRDFGAVVGEGAHSGIAIGGAYGSVTLDDNGDFVSLNQQIDAAATYGIRGIAIGTGALVANPDDFANLKKELSNPVYIKAKSEFMKARSNFFAAQTEWNAIKDLTPNDPTRPVDMRITETQKNAAQKAYEKALAEMNEKSATYSMALKEVVRLQQVDSAKEMDAIAIGTLANASIKDSIALGSKSVTDSNDKAGTRTGISGYDPLGKASDNDHFRGGKVGGMEYAEDDPVWRSTAGSLSLGGTVIKTDEEGNVVLDDKGNTITEKITRRISNVAAGIKDSDAVNVAQLKRATTISSDNRNTALGVDENGNMIVNSPFLDISGVKISSDYNTIVRQYGNAEEYKKGLKAQVDELESRISSLNQSEKTIVGIKKADGSYEVEGSLKKLEDAYAARVSLENEYKERQKLEEAYRKQEITKAEYDKQSANIVTAAEYNKKIKTMITEADYQSHLIEYKEQLEAIKLRRDELQKDRDAIAKKYDGSKEYETEYKEAASYFKAQANAYGKNAAAVGNNSKAGGEDSISFGTNNKVGTVIELTEFDAIENDTDEQKEKRQKEAARSIALGSGNTITGTADTDSSQESMALGVGNTITNANQAMAIGSGNIVEGDKSLAIGTENEVYGTGSGAIGDPTIINANNSYSIGNDNTIGGKGKDEDASVTLNNVFILGNNSSVDVNDTVVLGSNIHILEGMPESSVFLGNNAGYTSDTNVTGGATGTVSNATVGNITFGGFAGDTANGVVSVGYQGEIDGAPATTVRRIQNVAAGLISAESTDAINGSQLYAAIQAMSIDVKDDGTTTKVDKQTTTGGGGGGTGTAATTYTVKGSVTTIERGTNAVANNNLTLKEEKTGDPTSYKYTIDMSNNLKVDSVTAGDTVINNNGLTVGDTAITKNEVKATTFKAGDTTVNSSGITINNGPSMTKDGIDMKDKKITNVKAGEADNDAVNYGQLKDYVANNNQAVTNLGNQITGVENRMKKGLAGAAALAALHPMDFDPDDKLTFAAGMGHYRGENAAALGLFYRPDEKVMFSLGGTLGNGENMINAGVSFSLDRTPRVTGSRTALTKEVVQLREHVAKQDAQIAELTALVRQLAGNAGLQVPASSALPTEGPALFADNLDNKWVYDAIEDLEQRGYFNGYAGRALTRQQIAAALDMAMAGGAKLDERIVKEFEPELSHVRVAHVEGKGNEEGEWYERPRASHDKYEDKHKIEKKPFRVEEKKVTSKS